MNGEKQQLGSNVLVGAGAWAGLGVQHRHIGRGAHPLPPRLHTELAYILSGRSIVRRHAQGKVQEGMALPGTSWLAPVGCNESLLEFDGDTECLLIHLPPG